MSDLFTSSQNIGGPYYLFAFTPEGLEVYQVENRVKTQLNMAQTEIYANFLELQNLSSIIQKEVFTRVVAHDLANPLTAISMNTDFLRELFSKLDIPEAETIDKTMTSIHNSAQHIKTIIYNLRDRVTKEFDEAYSISPNELVKIIYTILKKVETDLSWDVVLVTNELEKLPQSVVWAIYELLIALIDKQIGHQITKIKIKINVSGSNTNLSVQIIHDLDNYELYTSLNSTKLLVTENPLEIALITLQKKLQYDAQSYSVQISDKDITINYNQSPEV